MRKKSEKVDLTKLSVNRLSDKQKSALKGGRAEEYTYDGGTMEEVIVTPEKTTHLSSK